jgi:membrane-bound serine protease (ClpP class)
VQNTVDNPDVKEVFSIYGVEEKSVRDSKPGWLDDFAAFIRRTEVSILLVIVAFAGLILEFKMPGATLPGLVALICFVLFFWAHAYANGQTVYLAIAMFVVGLILLGIELFILPGFGVSGIAGVLLILTGIGLATLEKAPSSTEEWTLFAGRLLQYGLTLIAAGTLSLLFARYLPKIPYANRLMLAAPADNPDLAAEGSVLPGAEQAASLLGQVGAATSMLRPAGMARFGDQYVDVVTEGDFIQPGTPIQVVEVEGTRIVVKKV